MAAFAVGFAVAARAAAAPKPHILLVLADDLGWANVGWHRDPPTPEVQTPVLDGSSPFPRDAPRLGRRVAAGPTWPVTPVSRTSRAEYPCAMLKAATRCSARKRAQVQS